MQPTFITFQTLQNRSNTISDCIGHLQNISWSCGKGVLSALTIAFLSLIECRVSNWEKSSIHLRRSLQAVGFRMSFNAGSLHCEHIAQQSKCLTLFPQNVCGRKATTCSKVVGSLEPLRGSRASQLLCGFLEIEASHHCVVFDMWTHLFCASAFWYLLSLKVTDHLHNCWGKSLLSFTKLWTTLCCEMLLLSAMHVCTRSAQIIYRPLGLGLCIQIWFGRLFSPQQDFPVTLVIRNTQLNAQNVLTYFS